MRRKTLVVLILIAALLSTLAAQAELGSCMITGIITNCKDYATLRSTPSTGAKSLERLYRGEYVTILSRDVYKSGEDFFVLVESDRNIGYVLIAYLDAVLDDYYAQQRDYYGIGYGTVTATNPGDDLILRSGPGTGYPALGYLYGGEVIPSLGMAQADENGRLWYCCSFDGTTVWISSRYTTLRRP